MDNDPTQPGTSLGRRGHAVFLRPVTDGDMPFLFYIATVGENLVRWRLRGRTVSPANFQQFVWTTTDVQFLICRTDSEEPVGHVCTYQTDEFSGTTKVAAVLAPSFHRLGWPMEGLYLFLSYLFDAFPFRRLYFETPDFNTSEFRWFMHTNVIEEGRLSEAVFFDGRYWDLLHNTLTRQGWEAFRESNLGRLVAAGLFRVPDGADCAPGVRAEGEALLGPAAESS